MSSNFYKTFDLFDIFVLILQVKAGERQGVPLASTPAPALAQSCGCERWRGLLLKARLKSPNRHIPPLPVGVAGLAK